MIDLPGMAIAITTTAAAGPLPTFFASFLRLLAPCFPSTTLVETSSLEIPVNSEQRNFCGIFNRDDRSAFREKRECRGNQALLKM